MQSRRTRAGGPPAVRAGFTLVELMVVIIIIALLMTLSAAAVLRYLSTQRLSNTQSLIRRLQARLDSQMRLVAQKAMVEPIGAGSTNPSAVRTAIVHMASNSTSGSPQERARAIWVKLRLKQAFPNSFAEALFPDNGYLAVAGGAGVSLPPLPTFQKYLSNSGISLSAPVGGGVSGVTNTANPTITTTSAHGLAVGQVVVISGVGGATGVNGTWTVASVPTGTSFTITAAAPGAYTSGGSVSVLTGGIPSPNGYVESSACLLLALQQGQGGGGISAEDIGTSFVQNYSYQSPAGSGPKLTVQAIVDGWGTPLAFCRWPWQCYVVNPSGTFPSGAAPGNAAQSGPNNDPFDPRGLLCDFFWLTATDASPPTGYTTFAGEFNGLLGYTPPAWTGTSTTGHPNSYVLAPLIVSAGLDQTMGIDPTQGALATATTNPSGTLAVLDDVFSAQLQ